MDVESHRKLGANLEIDIAYNYLTFFMEDDKRLEEIGSQYKEGKLLTSEVKSELISVLQKLVLDHQEKRKSLTMEIIEGFMKVRSFKK